MGTAVYAPGETMPRDISDSDLQAAIAAGGVRAVKMRDPKGDQRYVPLTSVQDAVRAGGHIDESTDAPKEGLWKALGQDLLGIAKAAPKMMGPGMLMEVGAHLADNYKSIRDTGKTLEETAFQDRVAAGRSKAYAAGAGVNETLGVNVKGEEAAADAGDPGGVIGHAAAVPVATAITAGVTKGVAKVAPEVAKFAAAESNPNKLYNSYLGPVADQAHPVPNAPPRVLTAVLKDMEDAGDGAAAERLRDGNATIGDLDQARQRANRLARSIYKSPGNYTTGMADGADQFARDIRETIYPEIEKAHGMEPGSLKGVKNLQGALMDAEKNPGLVKKIVTQGLGGGAGAYLGHATGVPGAEFAGAAIGSRIAEPVTSGINRGIIGLRTKGVAMNLPQPVAPAAAVVAPQPPIAGLLPAPATRLGPIPDVSGTPINPEVIPPAPNYTTRAQRLGLLLPERTGGTPLMEIKGEEAMKLLKAKSVVVRDPRTGRMVRMYVTSGESQ